VIARYAPITKVNTTEKVTTPRQRYTKFMLKMNRIVMIKGFKRNTHITKDPTPKSMSTDMIISPLK
jgi:hypothetical protein